MAATRPNALHALMHAALALPIVPIAAKAGGLEGAAVGVRWQDYREDGTRMHVVEPLVWLKAPLGNDYEVNASRMIDSISGASPRLVSNQTGTPLQTLSGASIVDRRRAADVKLTRRFGDFSLGVSRAVSFEKDYASRAAGIEARLDLNEKNTTLVAMYGIANDRIGSVDNPLLSERRDTREWLFGVTQLLSPVALVQWNVSLSRGSGFYNDPYKFTLSFQPDGQSPILFADTRPSQRNQAASMLRYRRHFPRAAGSLQMDYRLFSDSWGTRSHTLEAAWLQTLSEAWKIVPSIRSYSQSRADFYRAEVIGSRPDVGSSDQRLASFGALAAGLKLIYAAPDGTTVDISFTRYGQRARWKWGGSGSAEFSPLNAGYVMAGITHAF